MGGGRRGSLESLEYFQVVDACNYVETALDAQYKHHKNINVTIISYSILRLGSCRNLLLRLALCRFGDVRGLSVGRMDDITGFMLQWDKNTTEVVLSLSNNGRSRPSLT